MSAAVIAVGFAITAVAVALSYIVGQRDGWHLAMGHKRDEEAEHPLLDKDDKDPSNFKGRTAACQRRKKDRDAVKVLRRRARHRAKRRPAK